MLSASGSERSLSRLIITIAPAKKWHLISSSYCHAEVTRNVIKFSESAALQWEAIQEKIDFLPSAYSDNRPHLLNASKDKPVLFSALAARSAVLLTLDQKDFSLLLNTAVYGMFVMTPKNFLIKVGLKKSS